MVQEVAKVVSQRSQRLLESIADTTTSTSTSLSSTTSAFQVQDVLQAELLPASTNGSTVTVLIVVVVVFAVIIVVVLCLCCVAYRVPGYVLYFRASNPRLVMFSDLI